MIDQSEDRMRRPHVKPQVIFINLNRAPPLGPPDLTQERIAKADWPRPMAGVFGWHPERGPEVVVACAGDGDHWIVTFRPATVEELHHARKAARGENTHVAACP